MFVPEISFQCSKIVTVCYEELVPLTVMRRITMFRSTTERIYDGYAAPVWSNTSSSNYRQLQILQSKCLRVIGNYSRRTPITHLHTALNLEPIRDSIFRLTEKFFNCPTHPNPLVREIGNYSVADLHRQYKKYIHKRTKHLLL